MKITKYIFQLIRDFLIILSATTIFTSIFLLIFSFTMVPSSLLWQIILISFTAAFFDMIYYIEGWIDRIPLLIKALLHGILILILYLMSALAFRWFEISDYKLILTFLLLVVAGFALVYLFMCILDYKQAKLFNKKLVEYKQKRGEGNEQHS